MPPKNIAIVGFGKIAQDQHVPSIAETDGVRLAATVSGRNKSPEGIPAFPTLDALASSNLTIDAIAFCTPPEGRVELARKAIDYGWDILLEKPPGEHSAEVESLSDYAHDKGRVLFTTWHSQYNDAVDEAAKYLQDKEITGLDIQWREDVRKWHPGQDWIWQESGLGVFDPGINALSIISKIIPGRLSLKAAELIICENHESPIAVTLDFGAQYSATFDWRETKGECWEITIHTETQIIQLEKGGSALRIDGETVIAAEPREYQQIYRHFAALLENRQSHVTLEPLVIVERAKKIGTRIKIAAFES